MRWIFLAFFLCACASQEKEEYKSRAHPAAYAADSFLPYTPMPKRPPKKLHFYFKECSAIDGKFYYSNTSYICDDLNQ